VILIDNNSKIDINKISKYLKNKIKIYNTNL